MGPGMGRGMLRAWGHRLRKGLREGSEPGLGRSKLHRSGHAKVDAKLRRMLRAVLRISGRALQRGSGQGIQYRELWRGYTGKCEVRSAKTEVRPWRGQSAEKAEGRSQESRCKVQRAGRGRCKSRSV
jgi:hypothetical protein